MWKTKNIVIFLLFVMGSVVYSSAQQMAQYTQWSNNQLSFNPAHAGIKSCLDIHSLYRMQWVGFEGAPKSGFLTLSFPVNTKRKEIYSARHGLGAKLENDQIGQFQTNRFNLAYAAHFNFTPETRLSLGIYGGILQTSFDPGNLTSTQPDPAVMREASFVNPDASFGAWWNGKNYYFGLVVQQLFRPKWDLGNDSYYRFHTLLNTGYRLSINDDFTILPAALLKIPPRGNLALDLQTMVDYRSTFSFGLGYRNTDALLFFAGFKINQRFSLNYSFDFTLSQLRNVSNNTHEISLSFSTCKPENKNSVRCPLFE